MKREIRLFSRLATLALLLLCVFGAKAQTVDYSGTYYIASGGKGERNGGTGGTIYNYDPNDPTNNFYLCPTEGWCYYKPTNDFSNDGTTYRNPFLTTYMCRSSAYHSGDPSDAKWTIEKAPAPNSDYYYIKQTSTGKYLLFNGQIRTTNNPDRIRVHLEEVAESDLDDKALFSIVFYNANGFWRISPKSLADGDPDYTTTQNGHSDHKWLVVNFGNYNYLIGKPGKDGGPHDNVNGDFQNTAGTVGIYLQSDDNTPFYLEDYIQRPTIAYNLSSLIEITPAQTGTVTIKYTTDSSTPSADHGETYSGPFDVNDNVTTIKAVVITDEGVSNVATFQPFILLGSNHKRLIQNQSNPWDTDFHFYMIPGDPDNNNITRVNTTSLFRPSMEWYFLNAGIENGTQYYYIVNNSNSNSNSESLRYDANDTDNGICMGANDNSDEYKFRIVESSTAGTYNIIPHGLTTGNRFVTKDKGNNTANNVNLAGGNGTDAKSRWRIVRSTDLDKVNPFTPSDPSSNSYSYYTICNGSNGENKLSPPTGTNYVTAPANVDSDIVNWYFEEAQAADDADWLTYFHIRSAVTGDYLYFIRNDISSSACLEIRSTIDPENADRYMFTWAKTANDDVSYFILPKLLINKSLNNFSALRRNSDGTLITNLSRVYSAWTFPISSYHCAQPVINEPTETGYVITKTESDAKIYYMIGSGTLNPSTGTLYSGAISVADLGVESTTIRAIVARNSDGSDASEEATVTVNRVATPVFTTLTDGTVEITCATEGAEFYYTIGSNPGDPTTESTHYEGPIENAAGLIIKAIAVKDGWINSVVAVSEPIVYVCATPIIRKATATTFTIECSFPSGASIRYTKGADPVAPTPSSGTPYEGPVSFNLSELPFTVKAIAYATGYTTSGVAELQITRDLMQDPVDGYYVIASYDDFNTFVTMVNGNPDHAGANYKIIDDIDVSAGVGVISVNSFSGELKGVAKADGTFPVVSNLSHAIFNTIDGGKVNSVMLDDVDISTGTNVGAICNEATGASRIYNCGILATGSTVETDEDGYTTITDCSSTISGSGFVGGLVGLLDGESRVINCFSYANIEGGNLVGGIVGKNNVATTSSNLKTMVMNCMFYGDITGGTSKAPIYNGEIISNNNIIEEVNYGVSNFNYFWSEASFVKNRNINVYNCALAAETRFLQRFEFFRHLLNSNRALAAWWVTGDRNDKDKMLKWVMEPTQIGATTPYPILKTPGNYPSVVNYDAEHAVTGKPRNQGGKLGELTVNIQMGSGAVYGAPTGATINTNRLTLNITDKDTTHFNFNYYKVQLPYYNDVGTKNYTGYRAVTGWKIVEINGSTTGIGTYATGEDVSYDASDNLITPYNFADRNCTKKDLYSVSGRVFNQGAYWDVPEGVSSITIEPYWAKAAYLTDAYADVVYDTVMSSTSTNVPNVGGGRIYTNGNSYSIAGESQVVFTSRGDAIASSGTGKGLFQGVSNPGNHTVYDYALVLVGNYHLYANPDASANKPYTFTSIDLDGDNEPDYSYIARFDGRKSVHPVRVDFINISGLGMAQKSNGGSGTYNFGILQPKRFFESTNTSLFRVTQFEYDAVRDDVTNKLPVIVQGGVMEQWVGGQTEHKNNIAYFHVGGNVWFKEFHRGTHQDYTWQTQHPPVSVTGGDYDEFYLTGLYRGDVNNYEDNAECYINGGRFGIVCGAAMEGIGKADGADNTGNITWLIQNADIDEFYAGGLNAAKPVTGNLNTTITDSYIGIYCGGPKFGDMSANMTVTTTATGCTFGTFFGAGFGGNSYSRKAPFNHNNIINFPHSTSQAGNHASWNAWVRQYYTQAYDATYGGVSTQFNYQFLPMSSNVDNVARLFVEFVKFSLATTHSVTSTLTGCNIIHNFYGGGNLGKVDGQVSSVLESCTVNGNVYGAGQASTLPTVEVDSIGFRVEPWYDVALGTYLTGVKGKTTTYTWEHGSSISIDKINHILYTTENLANTNLGSVTGNVTLTIKGNSTVSGSVFGGGEESTVGTNDHPSVITVKLQDKTNVVGNVFGGGDNGKVEGNTEVQIIQPIPDPGSGEETQEGH